MVFAIANIATGGIIAVVDNLSSAARKLVPGTCWGSGESEREAKRAAKKKVAWIKKRIAATVVANKGG